MDDHLIFSLYIFDYGIKRLAKNGNRYALFLSFHSDSLFLSKVWMSFCPAYTAWFVQVTNSCYFTTCLWELDIIYFLSIALLCFLLPMAGFLKAN